MAHPGLFNDNRFRDYPLIERVRPVSGDPLPRSVVVDCGFVMGLVAEFADQSDHVYLYRIRRCGNRFTFEFRATSDVAGQESIVFVRDVGVEDYVTEWLESVSLAAAELLACAVPETSTSSSESVGVDDEVEVESSSLSSYSSLSEVSEDSEVPNPPVDNCVSLCDTQPLWSGFLVHGTLEKLIEILPTDGELVYESDAWVVEPARIQNLAGTFVRAISLGNTARTVATPDADCPPISPLTGVIVNARCLDGDIAFIEGFHVYIRQEDRANAIIIGAAVGAGAGEPCDEVPLSPTEVSPDGGAYLTGGPTCGEVLKTINGVGGRNIQILAGPGFRVEASGTAEHTLVIDRSLEDFALCFTDLVSETLSLDSSFASESVVESVSSEFSEISLPSEDSTSVDVSVSESDTDSDISPLPSSSELDSSDAISDSFDSVVSSVSSVFSDVSSSSMSEIIELLPYFYDGVSVGNLPFAIVSEISGITTAQRPENSGHLWAIDDGILSPIIMYAIDVTDASNQGGWTLSGTGGSDVEDIAGATVGGQPYIYVADTGDNAGNKASIQIHRIEEPVITGSNGTVSSGDITTITLQYAVSPLGETGNAGRDAECLLVDPDTGDIYIVTKRLDPPQLWYLPHQTSYVGTQTLTYLGEIFAIPLSAGASGLNSGHVVGGDIRQDGREIVLKSYTTVYMFQRPEGMSILAALQQTPTEIAGYVGGGRPSSHPNSEPKGEAITYDENGIDLFTASESEVTWGSSVSSFPLFRYDRLFAVPTEVSFQQGVSSYTGAKDTYIWSNPANQGDNRGSETSFFVDWDSGTSERYGLLSFDLSSIPAGSEIVGCDLLVTISATGERFRLHKMYQAWISSSTYTSLGGLPAFDDVDAASVADAQVENYAGISGVIKIKVPLSTIQNWIDGSVDNNGWVFYRYGSTGDGFQLHSCEAATSSNRPKLVVRYLPP